MLLFLFFYTRIIMYDVVIEYLVQFVKVLPVLFGLRLILDAIRNFIFGNNMGV